jgi:PAS domain S-box-containing protein
VGSAWLRTPDEPALRPVAAYRAPRELLAMAAGRTFPLDHPLLQDAVRLPGPIYVAESDGDPRFDHALFRALPHKSVLVAPMWSPSDVVGAFAIVWTRASHRLDADELRLVDAISRQATMAIENARLLDEVKGARDFLQSITENSADAIVTAGVDGSITSFSPAAQEILGYTAREMVGRPFAELYRSGAEEIQATMQRLGDEGRMCAHETVLCARDGRGVPVDASLSLLRAASGAVIGTLGIFKDATERSRLELALRQREAHFRSLIEHGADLIAVLDGDGVIHYASPSHERVLGRPAGDLIGIRFVDLVHPDDVAGVTEAFSRGVATPGTAVTRECRVRHRDGSWRLLEATGRNALDDPAVAGVVLNARDITAERQLEEQFRQSQKMEAVGRLAGGVAHDFNNLLAVIIGYSDLGLARLPERDPRRRDFEEISKAANRAASLTRQLLAFSRQQVLQPKVLDLNRVVADVEKMLRRLIGEDVTMVTSLEPRLGHVTADPGQIEQVLLNLVVNARDAMPHGGTLTIETATVAPTQEARLAAGLDEGPHVMLAVTDTGCGMDPSVLAHMFEPFFTTKEKGKGTGLGLATVYGIVKQSGGCITVESEPGRGSTFRVFLPRVIRSAEPVPEPAPVPAFQPGTETVLVVEDEPAVRGLIHRILVERGYSVIVAPDGPEALRLASARGRRPFHLLLTDVVMPQMSGTDLARRVLTDYPETKVLYMSGHTDHAVLLRDIRESGAAFIQKPFAPMALAAKVHEVLAPPAPPALAVSP